MDPSNSYVPPISFEELYQAGRLSMPYAEVYEEGYGPLGDPTEVSVDLSTRVRPSRCPASAMSASKAKPKTSASSRKMASGAIRCLSPIPGFSSIPKRLRMKGPNGIQTVSRSGSGISELPALQSVM